MLDAVVRIEGTLADGGSVRGSGFVVAVGPEVATVVTASHVIFGAQLEVIFGRDLTRRFSVGSRHILGMDDGTNPNGLAVFRVEGSLPAGVRALALDLESAPRPGEELYLVGFPQASRSPLTRRRAFSGRRGTLLVIDQDVGNGFSGGPVVGGGGVVGVVTTEDDLSTYAVGSVLLGEFLRGYGVRLDAKRDPVRVVRTSRVAEEVFRDCEACPQMVVIPAGRATIGSPMDEEGRDQDEGPLHEVRVPSFALGRFEVSRGEFASFVRDSGRAVRGCGFWDGEAWKYEESRSWEGPGFEQTAEHPVVCVSWEDASAYVAWLSRKSGEHYRLVSESEWEYAARAGTPTARHWGEAPAAACSYANVADETVSARYSGWTVHDCADGYVHTSPAGRFRPNAFGLYDMLGNVWEWVEDCWNDSYAGAPGDGSAWTTGDCARRVLRGGSWYGSPWFVRSALRVRFQSAVRLDDAGFRVARTLP